MPQANSSPAPEVLQQLHHMQDVPLPDLEVLAKRLEVLESSRGTVLVELGNNDDTTFYLLEGKVELLAEDGNRRVVHSHDSAARRPLCRLRPSRYRVKALSNVSYLLIDNQLIEDYLSFEESSSLLVDENYTGIDSSMFVYPDAQDALMQRVMEALTDGRMVLPSLPMVAEKVGRAVLNAGHDTRRLTRALMVDPTLAAKTIKAVNGKIAADESPVNTCEEAVQRLGPERVISLVVNCVLRETLHNPKPEVAERMQAWWERSLRVSAISYVLARLSERFDPHFAALAGLLHRIGEAALLYYANELPELDDPAALDSTIRKHGNEVGRLLLSNWNLSPDLVTVVSVSGNLLRDHAHAADYADIVLVAERHADIGRHSGANDITPDQMPAFRRLGLGDVSPAFSLKIVEAANGALAQAESMLAA
jgi:HD-like signal output (HDOD) protein